MLTCHGHDWDRLWIKWLFQTCWITDPKAKGFQSYYLKAYKTSLFCFFCFTLPHALPSLSLHIPSKTQAQSPWRLDGRTFPKQPGGLKPESLKAFQRKMVRNTNGNFILIYGYLWYIYLKFGWMLNFMIDVGRLYHTWILWQYVWYISFRFPPAHFWVHEFCCCPAFPLASNDMFVVFRLVAPVSITLCSRRLKRKRPPSGYRSMWLGSL